MADEFDDLQGAADQQQQTGEQTGVTNPQLGDAGQEQATGAQQADDAGQQQTGAETGPDAGDQQATQGQLEALRAEREKRQRSEQYAQMLERQFQLLQANQGGQQGQQQPQEQLSQQEKDLISEMGLDDDDVLTAGQARTILQRTQQQNQQQEQMQQFFSQATDYAQVVGSVNAFGQFVPAEPLQKACQANPMLAQRLNANPDPVYAYEIAKSYQKQSQLEQTTKAQEQYQNQQAAQTTTGPMSSAAVGGGGAISEAGRIAAMDDNQFAQLEAEVKSGKYG